MRRTPVPGKDSSQRQDEAGACRLTAARRAARTSGVFASVAEGQVASSVRTFMLVTLFGLWTPSARAESEVLDGAGLSEAPSA